VSDTESTDLPDSRLAEVVRRESGLIVAALTRDLRNFDLAEEAVAEAVAKALVGWRSTGVPDRPGAWLTTVARRYAVDRLRSPVSTRVVLTGDPDVGPEPSWSEPTSAIRGDDRVAMLFGCCHPSLAVEARLALTLRAVLGVTTAQIAAAFLQPEPTIAQRIVRAKRKIVANGIALAVPDSDDLAARLHDVLTVVLLAYNARFLEPADPAPGPHPRADRLTEDAIWLAGLIATELPHEPEAMGLLALLMLHESRAAARFDPHGRLILLADQDRGRWDHPTIARAERLLERAALYRRPGRFQLMAAIAACHASAPSTEETDWLQVLTLYDLLLTHDPSPVVRLNHAIALAEVLGPEAGLSELDSLGDSLAAYHLFYAARADLLRRCGRLDDARIADQRALDLTTNAAERNLLTDRLTSAL
jgi:RNA polymerase sigma-70 factor (ECF subfamily)